MITKSELRRLFDYKDGKLIRKVYIAPNAKVGCVAGSLDRQSGYRRICVNGVSYHEHRLVWIWHNGHISEQIDHIDQDRSNNRIDNLRDTSQSMNTKNSSLRSDNTSGHVGVSKQGKKWIAYVNVDSKRIHIGLFDHKKDAVSARRRANLAYGFTNDHGKAK